MPLIKQQDKTERVEVKVRIDPAVLSDLRRYVEFADSDEWYCVQELLREAMSRDKEFQAHLGKEKKRVSSKAVAVPVPDATKKREVA
jgi:hypothetical protein